MATYIVRRLLQAALVLVVVTVLAFVLIYLTGDPAKALVPLDARPEDVELVRRQLGLDQPLYVQYLRFVAQLLHGDLGQSFKFQEGALGLVLARLPNTALLAVASMAISLAVSLPLGVLGAVRRGGLLDWLATGFSMLAISTPSFWLGIVLILLFADRLRLLPASGAGTWQHLLLPAATLAAQGIGLLTRLVRATMTDVLRQRYVTTARAKGLREGVVVLKHALRNALIPVVTVLGLQFGALLGGAVVVESVFAWPGLGWLLIQAINARDLPLIRAAVLVIAAIFVAINLAVDLLYVRLDPRIRYA